MDMEISDLKDKIKKNMAAITRTVRYGDIRDYMIQELFSREDDEEVMALTTNRDKMRQCLALLDYRGSKAYAVFIDSLTDSYGFMRDQIIQTKLTPREKHKTKPMPPEADDEVNHDTIRRLSRQPEVMQNWKMFARNLGLHEADILDIGEENRNRLSECVYQTVVRWKARCRYGEATKAVIYTTLWTLDLLEASDTVFQ